MSEEIVLVVLTAGSADEAALISSALIEERLAACVNELPGVNSRYWWEGRQDSATEVLLLAKTRRSLWAALLDRVRTLHSYQVFEAIALPIVEANPDYRRWILENTRGGDECPAR